jgi:hypothetical protein
MFFLLFPYIVPPSQAGAGGPDAYGISYVDSEEASGPPFAALGLDGGHLLSFGADGLALVELPFGWWWYDEEHSSLTVSQNGAVFFGVLSEEPVPSCPGQGDGWSGIAAYWDEWSPVEVRWGEFGAYPDRVFALEWSGANAAAGGYGTVQLWLTEGGGSRPEAVIVLDDIDFGDPSADGGTGAFVGLQHSTEGTGVAWSCTGGLVGSSVAWFGRAGFRVSAAERRSDDLPLPWTGSENHQYLGRSMATGSVNGDSYGDLLIGNQDSDQVFLLFGEDAFGGLPVDDAGLLIEGEYQSDFGTSVSLGDLDGDGLDDIVAGAPKVSGAVSSVGTLFAFSGDLGSSSLSSGDADLVLEGPSSLGSAKAGNAVALADLDGDGYLDLLVGAYQADAPSSDAGAVLLWPGSAAVFEGEASLDDAAAQFRGGEAIDWAGFSLAAADLDGDGAAEVAVGAPRADTLESTGGLVYLLPGASYSGSQALDVVSQAQFAGSVADGKAGYSVAMGDVDHDGLGDLFVGAPYVGSSLTQVGGIYGFLGASELQGQVGTSQADIAVLGETASSHAGQSLAVLDANGDDVSDLVVTAPNSGLLSSGGGMVAIFTDLDSTDTLISQADLLLHGADSAGSLGTALAGGQDADGDGIPDLFLSSPYADAGGYTGSGKIFRWHYGVDFLDADGDGFISSSGGGLDCEDGDASIYPSAVEDTGNRIDDDCDGWVDSTLMLRTSLQQWIYEAESMGMIDYDVFDFEEGAAGDPASAIYTPVGLSIFGSGSIELATSVHGSAVRGALCAKVLSSSVVNQLRLYFEDPVDAFGFYLLDGEGQFELSAALDGDYLAEEIPVAAVGDNIPGGRFVGAIFSESVDFVVVQGELQDGFGVDDLMVVWSTETDTDGDGYTEVDGDCDDADPAVNPAAEEDLSNGVDDDCNGAIDGGFVDFYEDEATWIEDAGFTPEVVDFEEVSPVVPLTDEYLDLGVLMDSQLAPAGDVSGTAPRQVQAGLALGDETRFVFTELQSSLGFYALDVASSLRVAGYRDGELLYDHTVEVLGEDQDGGSFVGMRFDYGVDELLLAPTAPFDDWGIDDLSFHPLGQDDADGDGYSEQDGDCDDSDGEVNPDAEEIWYDGVDSDCVGDGDFDADGDGHTSSAWGGTDCDDVSVVVNPDSEEIWYDGVDQNCDALSDYDADMDGHESSTYTYGAGEGSDCNDGDGAINPDAEEVPYDDVDDNCNAADDNDADGDGYPAAGYGSGGGFAGGVVVEDCDDDDPHVSPESTELWYDGIDQDCSGGTDFDADADGYENTLYGGDDCNDQRDDVNPGAVYDLWYDGVDQDCDGRSDFDQDEDGYDIDVSGGADCDDEDPSINPDGIEIARDGIDQNCDGALEFDDDGDGFDGEEDGGSDCDDEDPSVHPAASEQWYDGIDQDCDGQSDYDADGDGHDSDGHGGDDCDDSTATTSPSATDYYYDGIDNDCDGLSDFDSDGDGFPADWYGGDDCDDNDPAVHPDAQEEWYDGVDQNCDGNSDFDADGDGQDAQEFGGYDCDDGDADISTYAEEIPFDGIDQDCDLLDDVDEDGDGSLSSVDCNDLDASVHPDAPDSCYDGIDSDCDGHSDLDCDRDGADSEAYGGSDCDDGDPAFSPLVAETWYDGIDSNCDGASDYDADGDGHLAEDWGGDDCEDHYPEIHPGIAVDGCGGGNEDCDSLVDEDCESAPSEPSQEEPAAEPESVEEAEEVGVDTGGLDEEPGTQDGEGDGEEGTDTPGGGESADADGVYEGGPGQESLAPGGIYSGLLPPEEEEGCTGCASSGGPLGSRVLLWLLGICVLRARYRPFGVR